MKRSIHFPLLIFSLYGLSACEIYKEKKQAEDAQNMPRADRSTISYKIVNDAVFSNGW